jgi:hypothetical protein
MIAKLQHPLVPKRKYCFSSKHKKSSEKQSHHNSYQEVHKITKKK